MAVTALPRGRGPRPGVRARVCALLALALFLFAPCGGVAAVYDAQPPMTDKELTAFIELLPHFRAWAISSHEEAHPAVVRGKADFVYSAKAADWVRLRNWEPQRFFCVMGRAAAALSIVEEGHTLNDKRPPDMPSVTQQELDLVRRHLLPLLRAGSDAPPIQ